MQLISNVITRIDFLIASIEEQEIKEGFNNILKRYQTQRRKILNLKRAWERVFERQIYYLILKILKTTRKLFTAHIVMVRILSNVAKERRGLKPVKYIFVINVRKDSL